jgi:hypothetical protein
MGTGYLLKVEKAQVAGMKAFFDPLLFGVARCKQGSDTEQHFFVQ